RFSRDWSSDVCSSDLGLMTAGESGDQDRAVAWARDHGVNHFDTAPGYGDGASEANLGRALGRERDNIIVSTKVRLAEADLARPEIGRASCRERVGIRV